MVKNRNFCWKSKILSKIETFVENQNFFCVRVNFMLGCCYGFISATCTCGNNFIGSFDVWLITPGLIEILAKFHWSHFKHPIIPWLPHPTFPSTIDHFIWHFAQTRIKHRFCEIFFLFQISPKWRKKINPGRGYSMKPWNVRYVGRRWTFCLAFGIYIRCSKQFNAPIVINFITKVSEGSDVFHELKFRTFD